MCIPKSKEPCRIAGAGEYWHPSSKFYTPAVGSRKIQTQLHKQGTGRNLSNVQGEIRAGEKDLSIPETASVSMSTAAPNNYWLPSSNRGEGRHGRPPGKTFHLNLSHCGQRRSERQQL